MSQYKISRLLFWLMLPVSAIQGLFLRSRALRLPPPEGKISGSCGQGEPLHLLAMGDSIIVGVGARDQDQTLPLQLARQLADCLQRQVSWRILGENGARLGDLLNDIAELKADTPADVILLSVGVNDVTGMTTLASWRRQLQKLVKEIDSRWPDALVIFSGLPPMGRFPLPPQPLRFSLGLRAKSLDLAARQLLAGNGRMMHVAPDIDPQAHEFCEDGFHPSSASYAIWAEALAERVMQQELWARNR